MATGWRVENKQVLWKTISANESRNLLLFCKVLLSTIFLFDCLVLNTVEGHVAIYENRILHEVISKYSNSVRPSVEEDVPINFTLDITFNNIIDVNEKHQILTTSIWVRQHWTNPLTVWNVSEYGGLKEIIIDSRKIWQPDTVLYSNVYAEHSGRLDDTVTRVRLSHNGSTYWAAPFIFKTLCKINVADFPFDTQICKLTFGTWQYNGHEVNIINNKKVGAIASTRVENGEWEVLQVLIERKEVFYQCCPNHPYPEVSFIIHMKRRPLFYVVNLVLPNILISLLAFFSFFIPVECGERISFVITVLLSMTVFMLLVAESIPPTSDAVPVIGIYYTFSIIEVFLALLATGVSLKINYSYMFGDGLSPRLKKVLFNVIGPCLRFNVQNILGNKKDNKLSSESSDLPCHKDAPQKSSVSKTNENGVKGSSALNEVTINSKRDMRLLHGAEVISLVPRRRQELRGCGVDGDAICISRKEEFHPIRQRVTESKLAAAIMDRLFMIFFLVTYLPSTFLVLLVVPLSRS